MCPIFKINLQSKISKSIKQLKAWDKQSLYIYTCYVQIYKNYHKYHMQRVLEQIFYTRYWHDINTL